MFMLLSFVLLFSTVKCAAQLRDQDMIDNLQAKYLSMLTRYLKYCLNDKDANNRVAEAVCLVSVASKAENIMKMRLPF